MDDIYQIFNTPQPVVYGGTGLTALGTAGQFLAVNSGATALEYRVAPYSPGTLWGLTLSNNATDATNDIDIAVGAARSSLDVANIDLLSALTKRLDAAWAVGTNQGGLDTGSIANTTYHVFLIKRPDTGVVDALFSASATAPTLPANYTLFRRIGSIVRLAAAIKAFVQDADYFTWSAPADDINAANPGTSAVTRTMTVPVGIRVRGRFAVLAYTNGTGSRPGGIYISDLAVTDIAPTAIGTFSVWGANGAAVVNGVGSVVEVYTNTSAQVRSRVDTSSADTFLRMGVIGWVDTRGRT